MCMRVSMCIVVDVFDVGAMQLFKSDLDVVVHEVGLLSLVCEWVWLWWVSMT